MDGIGCDMRYENVGMHVNKALRDWRSGIGVFGLDVLCRNE